MKEKADENVELLLNVLPLRLVWSGRRSEREERKRRERRTERENTYR